MSIIFPFARIGNVFIYVNTIYWMKTMFNLHKFYSFKIVSGFAKIKTRAEMLCLNLRLQFSRNVCFSLLTRCKLNGSFDRYDGIGCMRAANQTDAVIFSTAQCMNIQLLINVIKSINTSYPWYEKYCNILYRRKNKITLASPTGRLHLYRNAAWRPPPAHDRRLGLASIRWLCMQCHDPMPAHGAY